MATMISAKVIYGADDRVDLVDVINPKYKELASSTAAMVSNNRLSELNNEQVVLAGKTLVETGVCSTERFALQPTAARCSGFLVGEDILVTAGHCIQSQFDCDQNSWVFDYKVDFPSQSEVVVDKSNIYQCESIISSNLDSVTQSDYAVVKLSKKVLDRGPLKFRRSGMVSISDRLVVIGHPSGLPTKVAAGAKVRSVNDIFMVTNLDTYGGNSGSAVFNELTKEVEGILVRGDTDYVWDPEQQCRVSNVLSDRGGRGEDVTLITIVEGLPAQVLPIPGEIDPEDPAQDPDEDDSAEDGDSDERTSWWQRFLEWLGLR